LQDHLQRIGNWQDWYGDDLLPEPEEVSLEEIGLFEQEQGGYKKMTYREFIDDCFGGEYEFKGAELVCWREV